MSYPSLAVTVPVFNEGPGVASSCKAIMAVIERYPGRAEMIAVDDGSNDNGPPVLRDLAAGTELFNTVSHATNSGYGAACRTGGQWASEHRFDYVAFIDSDLTNPPEDLLKIGELAASGADYVKGSRFLPGGGVEHVPRNKRVISQAGNRIASILMGLPETDNTNGFRGARTELYCSWPLHENGFVIIMEEMYWAHRSGARIAAFPTILHTRGESQGESSFSYTPRVMRDYLRYPLKSFGRRLRRSRRG